MKRLGVSEPFTKSAANTRMFVNEDGRCCIIVSMRTDIPDNHTELEVFGLLVHEATHVWQFILEHIGEEGPGYELEAYAMQAIAQELLQAFRSVRQMKK